MGQPGRFVETGDLQPRDLVAAKVELEKGGHPLDILPAENTEDVDAGVEVGEIYQSGGELREKVVGDTQVPGDRYRINLCL